MLIDGIVMKDGMDIVAYLDQKLSDIQKDGKTVTGIIIGSNARIALSRACQQVLGMPLKDEETVNRFRGALLIEDGEDKYRLEIVSGVSPTVPLEGDAFSRLRKVPRGGR